MDSSLINQLVQWLPTILVGLMVLWSLLGGLVRGFRKSLILFIHYIVAVGAGYFIFTFIKKALWDPNNQTFAALYPSIGSIAGYDFSGCTNIYECLAVVCKSISETKEYASLLEVAELQQLIASIAGLVVNFALAIVCLIVIPWVIRIILYLFYLIIWPEGRIKRRAAENDEDYSKKAFLGMIVGIVKGVVIATLSISLFSSLFFVITGGIYYTDSSEAEADKPLSEKIDYKSLIGEGLIDMLEGYGVNIDDIFKALKSQRTTGAGAIYSKIKVNGEEIDYFWFDTFFSSDFLSMELDEEGNQITKKFNLRKEIAMITSLVYEVLDSEAVNYAVDGTITINKDKLNDEFREKIEATVKKSVLLGDIVPMAIVGAATAINEDKFNVDSLSLGENFTNAKLKAYFTDERIQSIKSLNFGEDIASVFSIAVRALSIVPLKDNGELDLESLDTAKIISLVTDENNKQVIKDIFNDLADIKFLTEAVFPIGVTYFVDTLKADGTITDEMVGDIDLENVDWKYELANIGEIYDKVVALDLDYDCLINNTEHVEEGPTAVVKRLSEEETTEESKELDNNIKYLLDLAQKEEFINGIGEIFDLLIGDKASEGETQKGSYFIGQLAVTAIRYVVSSQDITLVEATDTEEAVTLKSVLGDNLTNYKPLDLKEDLKSIFTSCAPAIPVIMPLLNLGEGGNLISTLLSVDVNPLKAALVGSLYKEKEVTEESFVTDGSLYILDENEYKAVTSGEYNAETKYYEKLSSYEGGLYDLKLFKATKTVGEQEVSYSKLDDVLPKLLGNALSSVSESAQEKLDSVTDWKNELVSLVDAVEALQDVEGFENLDTSNVLGTLPTISNENANNISKALSKSVVLSGVLKDVLVSTLDGIDMLAQKDAGGNPISWNDVKDKDGNPIEFDDVYDEDGTLVSYGEINSLLKAISALTEKDIDGNPLIDLNNISINALSKLERRHVDAMTGSKILTIALDGVCENQLGNIEGVALVIPNDLTWGNVYTTTPVTQETFTTFDSLYYYDNVNGYYQKVNDENYSSDITYYTLDNGELWNLVQILQMDVLYKDNAGVKELDLASLSSISTWKNLDTTSNYDDVDKLMASRIISESLPGLVDSMLGPSLGYTKYTNGVKDDPTKLVLSDFIDDWNLELHSLINVLTDEKINLIDDNGDMNTPSLDTLANTIERVSATELNTSSAQNFAKSVIISRVLSDKVAEIGGSDSLSIVVPASLTGDNWTGWSYKEVSGENKLYETGEIVQLAKVMFFAKEAVQTGGAEVELTGDNMITGVLSMQDHRVLTDSEVLYHTVSKVLIDKSTGTSPLIKIRSSAFTDSTNSLIKKEEISIAFDALNSIGINDLDSLDISVSTVTEAVGNESTRQLLCNSNVLNITVVDKLISSTGGTLTIPTEINTAESPTWYPAVTCYYPEEETDVAKQNAWKACELNLTFIALNELTTAKGYKEVAITSSEFVTDGTLYTKSGEVYSKVTTGSYSSTETYYKAKQAGINVEGSNIDFNIANLISSLSDEANSNSAKTKLVVVYESQLLAVNISDKISEQSVLSIKDAAYIDNDSSKNLKVDEIKMLIDFMNDNDLDINNMAIDKLLDLMGDASARATMCFSNILSKTVVSKVVEGAGSALRIPASLRVGGVMAGDVDLDSAVWYPSSTSVMGNYPTWKNCELNLLLVSISELGITASGDSVTVDTESILGELNNPASSDTSVNKIDLIYDSRIFSQTISGYIIDANLTIPTSYTFAHGEASTPIVTSGLIAKSEVVKLTTIMGSEYLNISLNGEAGKTSPSNIKPSTILDLADNKLEYVTSSAIIALKVAEVLSTSGSVTVPSVVKFTTTDSNSANIDGVYSNELAQLLIAVKSLGFDLDNASTFDLSAINVTDLNTSLNNSIIFHATMSDQLANAVTLIPAKFYQSYTSSTSYTLVDVVEQIGYTGSLTTEKYLTIGEISSAVSALQELGLTDAGNASSAISDSGYLSSLSGKDLSKVQQSAIICTMLSSQLAGVEKPETQTVQNECTEWFRGSSSDKIVNGNEIVSLIEGIGKLGITDIGNADSISIQTLVISDLNSAITDSYILRATLSKKITEALGSDIPNKSATGSDTMDSLSYLVASEITSLIGAFQSLTLDFKDISASVLSNVSISTVAGNFDTLMASSVIHKLFSDNMVGQSIVPTTYKKNSAATAYNVTVTQGNSTYIEKNELEGFVNGLSILGITDVASASSIDSSFLSKFSGAEKDTYLGAVGGSYILNKIFSEVLSGSAGGGMTYYQAVSLANYGNTTHYVTYNVVNANGGANITVLYADDIQDILSKVAGVL